MYFFLLAAVSLLAVVVFAASAFIVKLHALADLRKLPGPKPHILFGNILQLDGKADGK